MKPFNGLSPAQAERLAILAEECGEVVQVVGKILRHGYESSNPHDPGRVTNRDHLEDELGNVRAATTLLTNAGDVSLMGIHVSHESKLKTVHKYTHEQGE